MIILAAFIVLTALLALVCFGLSILLINIVGLLWPAKSKSQLDRVVMVASARQT